MSSAIHSANPSTATEAVVAAAADEQNRYFNEEMIWAKRLCLFSPTLAIFFVPVVHHFLLFMMYLQNVPSDWEIAAAFRSKIAVAVALAIAALPWAWWIGLKLDGVIRRQRMPWAVVLSLLATIAFCVLLSTGRVTWFFVEWVKVRTPNPSFARNTLFWEQRNFERLGNDQATANVGLIGSSQTYQGFDLKLLEKEYPGLAFEKNTLAGFGPMQYPFLINRIEERQFNTVICQLSEFDFFREDSVPVNRLRWAASTQGVANIFATLSPGQSWSNRGELADLAFAAVVPLWRQRDHFQRTVFGYWWKKSDPPPTEHEVGSRLADAPALDDAIGFLKQNVGHKQLVEANFRSFRIFAEDLKQQGIRLVVVEGQVHPAARSAYDTDGTLQQATTERLSGMSADVGFEYDHGDMMPAFLPEDFADAYHLNEKGRQKLTTFLISVLQP